MSLSLSEIAVVAQAVLDRLSYDGLDWTVARVVQTEIAEPYILMDIQRRGLEIPQPVQVVSAATSDPSRTIITFYSPAIPTQLAIYSFAGALQDEIIETVRAAVPPCPGHTHPLIPRLEGGHAVWGCPLGGGPTQPIWPPPDQSIGLRRDQLGSCDQHEPGSM